MYMYILCLIATLQTAHLQGFLRFFVLYFHKEQWEKMTQCMLYPAGKVLTQESCSVDISSRGLNVPLACEANRTANHDNGVSPEAFSASFSSKHPAELMVQSKVATSGVKAHDLTRGEASLSMEQADS